MESEQIEGELNHVVFKLNFKNEQFARNNGSSANLSMRSGHNQLTSNFAIKSEVFFELFPFHIVFNKKMEIVSLGEGLQQALKHAEGEIIKELFNMVRPLISFSWDNVSIHSFSLKMTLVCHRIFKVITNFAKFSTLEP